MKAIGYYQPGPITEPNSLVLLDLPDPVPAGRDLLVEVRAVSVNPVDTKRRKKFTPPAGEAKILGYDAAGIVRAKGPGAELFEVGDEVWYAGSILRQGSNAELQLVDERIVGKKPESLDFASAAALPLTALTAWELLFDRLAVPRCAVPSEQSLLIVGAAGGVGSILVQLARQLTGMKVFGTASRPETADWVLSLGADVVLDHSHPLSEELKAAGIEHVTHVASLTQTDRHYEQLVECLAPQGKFSLIDDPPQLDVSKLKLKSLSLHWELMFTRSMFETPDMIEQHRILTEVARLVDEKTIRTTVGEHLGKITVENLKRAHELIESGTAKGKLVLESF